MKAEKYGTWSEQSRFRRGYRRPSDLPKEDGRRCATCACSFQPVGQALRSCTKLGCAVASQAQCHDWQSSGREATP